MKKLLVTLMCVVMVVALMPAMAFATTTVEVDTPAAFKTNLEAGNNVKLTGDFELETTVNVNGDVTLDLNGHTITGKDNASSGNFNLIVLSNSDKLTIKDETGNGAITLTATTNRGWGGMSTIIENRGGIVDFYSGSLIHKGGSDMAFAVNVNANYADSPTLNVYGGNIESTYTAIRCYMWSGDTSPYLNIEGGYIEGGKRGVWAHAPENATGQTATIKISDGTVVGGTIDTTSGHAIKTTNSNPSVVTAEITGGAVDGNIAVYDNELSVSGGVFTADVEAYVTNDIVTATYTVEEEGTEITVNIVGKALVDEVLVEKTEGILTITNLPEGTTLAAPKEGLTVTNGTDESIKVGEVTVEKDKDYVAPKEEPKEEPKEDTKIEAPKTEVPKTGDMTDMMPWLAIMAVTAVGAIYFKKREN